MIFPMKTRTFLATFFLLIGLVAGWMTWLTWRAGEDSRWLFGVFTAFFLVFAAAPFLPASEKKKEDKEVPNTRFVPAWKTEGMILLAVVLVVLSLVARCLHPVK
jgi:hypothetical protein